MEHFFKSSVSLGHVSQNFTQNYERRSKLSTHWRSKVVLLVFETKMVLKYKIGGFLAVVYQFQISATGNLCFTKLSVDFLPFQVFGFYHRAYSKTRKPREIMISWFFELLRLFMLFTALEHNSQSCFWCIVCKT